MKSIITKTTVAVFSLVAFQAYAAVGTSKYVESVNLGFPGMAAIINVENIAANKVLSSLDLKVKTTSMNFEIQGSVKCKGTNIEFLGSKAHFGSVNIINNGQQINDTSTLYNKVVAVGFADSDNKIIEATPTVFTVPLNSINNGHPSLRINPLEELNKKLQAHIQGGGKEIDFYKQDQDILLQRPISLSGSCRKKNNVTKASVGYETKNHNIQIKYKGDPSLVEAPVLNKQLGNLPNQIDLGDQPFKLNSAEFMANIPHHFGQCLPTENSKIRVNYKMTGNELGNISFRIVAVSNTYADYGTYFETLSILKNPEQAGGNSFFEFEFPLKELLAQNKYSYMAISNNKTYSHNMKLQARYKPQNGEMSQWEDYDSAIFKHRCVPQVNLPLGANGGINYSNGANNPLTIKPIQAIPSPKRLGKAMSKQTFTPKQMLIESTETKPPRLKRSLNTK